MYFSESMQFYTIHIRKIHSDEYYIAPCVMMSYDTPGNAHDPFAVSVCKKDDIVGHILQAMSPPC